MNGNDETKEKYNQNLYQFTITRECVECEWVQASFHVGQKNRKNMLIFQLIKSVPKYNDLLNLF